MRVCIPTETDRGLEALLYGHFGSAPYFTIVDIETGTVEIRDNQGRVHAHGACHPVGAIDGLGVQAVVCGGMGLRALQKLEEAGIEVFRSGAPTVAEAIREIKDKSAEKLTMEATCAHHHRGCR